MNVKAKGIKNEHRSMKFYEKMGFQTMRSSASLSLWDFHAWDQYQGHYIQVKTGRWPGTEEMEALKEAVVPKGSRKFVHRWMPMKRDPEIREIV